MVSDEQRLGGSAPRRGLRDWRHAGEDPSAFAPGQVRVEQQLCDACALGQGGDYQQIQLRDRAGAAAAAMQRGGRPVRALGQDDIPGSRTRGVEASETCVNVRETLQCCSIPCRIEFSQAVAGYRVADKWGVAGNRRRAENG